MPRPERRPRIDSYGKPLPELTDAREQVLFEHATNQAQHRFLLALIEESCRAVLRRGWYGDVHLHFSVEDGVLQSDMRAGLERQWRAPRE